jgi:hypothetical protein
MTIFINKEGKSEFLLIVKISALHLNPQIGKIYTIAANINKLYEMADNRNKIR